MAHLESRPARRKGESVRSSRLGCRASLRPARQGMPDIAMLSPWRSILAPSPPPLTPPGLLATARSVRPAGRAHRRRRPQGARTAQIALQARFSALLGAFCSRSASSSEHTEVGRVSASQRFPGARRSARLCQLCRRGPLFGRLPRGQQTDSVLSNSAQTKDARHSNGANRARGKSLQPAQHDSSSALRPRAVPLPYTAVTLSRPLRPPPLPPLAPRRPASWRAAQKTTRLVFDSSIDTTPPQRGHNRSQHAESPLPGRTSPSCPFPLYPRSTPEGLGERAQPREPPTVLSSKHLDVNQ